MRLLRYLLFSTLAALSLLLVLEGLVRLSGLVDIHRTRGWGHNFECCGDLRPDQKILSLIVPDHPYVVTTNHLGLRRTEETQREATDPIRILAIGDSFTFGPYVADDETWPAQLEQRLRESFPEEPIEVLNAGIASYTISDELAYLKEKGLSLQPDLVILEVTHNDVTDLRKAQRGLFARPTVSVQTVWKQKIKSFLYDHSSLVSGLVVIKNSALLTQVTQGQQDREEVQLMADIVSGVNTQYDEGYERAFTEFVQKLSANHIPLVLLFYPTNDMVETFQETTSRSAMEMLVTSLAQNNNIQLLSASDILAPYDTTFTYLLPRNGHPSQAGYTLTAQAIHDSLLQLPLFQALYVQK